MTNSKIRRIIEQFGEKVKEYAHGLESAQADKKLARALKGVADVLGSEGVLTVNDTIVTASTFTQWAEDFETADFASVRDELVTRAKLIESYVEDELVEGTEAEIATAALALWAEIKPSRVLTVAGERQSEPDFDFPIFATCEMCDATIKTGERSGTTDWNSLRHYAQKHAKEVHASPGFGAMVSNAWKSAKKEFADNEPNEVVVSGDETAPGFILSKAS